MVSLGRRDEERHSDHRHRPAVEFEVAEKARALQARDQELAVEVDSSE